MSNYLSNRSDGTKFTLSEFFEMLSIDDSVVLNSLKKQKNNNCPDPCDSILSGDMEDQYHVAVMTKKQISPIYHMVEVDHLIDTSDSPHVIDTSDSLHVIDTSDLPHLNLRSYPGFTFEKLSPLDQFNNMVPVNMLHVSLPTTIPVSLLTTIPVSLPTTLPIPECVLVENNKETQLEIVHDSTDSNTKNNPGDNFPLDQLVDLIVTNTHSSGNHFDKQTKHTKHCQKILRTIDDFLSGVKIKRSDRMNKNRKDYDC